MAHTGGADYDAGICGGNPAGNDASLPAGFCGGRKKRLLARRLFTATTSVCVTGLVTVPTATTWSTFGKIVILGLIQFGGLGIMACLTMVFLILRRKISLQSRKLIQDTYNLPVLKGSVGIVRKLLIGTAAVELAGAFFYSFWFVPEYGFWKGIGYSLFHSVSAFCNAGIDLVGESSFAPFVTNPLINFTTMG